MVLDGSWFCVYHTIKLNEDSPTNWDTIHPSLLVIILAVTISHYQPFLNCDEPWFTLLCLTIINHYWPISITAPSISWPKPLSKKVRQRIRMTENVKDVAEDLGLCRSEMEFIVLRNGYGSIPIYIPFLGGWTSINPSYFDVNRRGTRFSHTARWTWGND